MSDDGNIPVATDGFHYRRQSPKEASSSDGKTIPVSKLARTSDEGKHTNKERYLDLYCMLPITATA